MLAALNIAVALEWKGEEQLIASISIYHILRAGFDLCGSASFHQTMKLHNIAVIMKRLQRRSRCKIPIG